MECVLCFALGFGINDEDILSGTIEAEFFLTEKIAIKYHHTSSLENGLYREDSDTNVIYIKYDFR